MQSSPATTVLVERFDSDRLDDLGVDPDRPLAWDPDDDDLRAVADGRRRVLARRRIAELERHLRECRDLERFWRSVVV